jgi:hypothetical protein
MSLLYKLYYTRYCLYIEDYIDSLVGSSETIQPHRQSTGSNANF